MDHLLEPVSPSPSTPSSGSPSPDDNLSEHIATGLITPQSSQHDKESSSPTLVKRRLASGGSAARDIKSRKREEGMSRRAHAQGGDVVTRDAGRKEELLDQELMDKIKHGMLSSDQKLS